MDLHKAARYFDCEKFDLFDFSTGQWLPQVFTAQLKKADVFVSIWNRPTRKRMMYTAPDQEPGADGYVVRTPGGVIMMVGNKHPDEFKGPYRSVFGLHYTAGEATIYRRTPRGGSGDPGWASETLIQATWADTELRSADNNHELNIEHYGNFFLFMPRNAPIQRDDRIALNGSSYMIEETYLDTGLMCARCTNKPDERRDFVFRSYTGKTNNLSTGDVVATFDSYNVTGRIRPTKQEQLGLEPVIVDDIYVMIRKEWIGVSPKPLDEIVFLGKTFKVERVGQNALLDEWYVEACV